MVETSSYVPSFAGDPGHFHARAAVRGCPNHGAQLLEHRAGGVDSVERGNFLQHQPPAPAGEQGGRRAVPRRVLGPSPGTIFAPQRRAPGTTSFVAITALPARRARGAQPSSVGRGRLPPPADVTLAAVEFLVGPRMPENPSAPSVELARPAAPPDLIRQPAGPLSTRGPPHDRRSTGHPVRALRERGAVAPGRHLGSGGNDRLGR